MKRKYEGPGGPAGGGAHGAGWGYGPKRAPGAPPPHAYGGSYGPSGGYQSPGGPPPMGRDHGPPRGRREGPARTGFHLDLPPEPNMLQQLAVHKRMVGKIIGPGGETASSIRRAAHCGLHVRKETNPDDTQLVEISGNATQIRAGIDKVMSLLKEEIEQDPQHAPQVLPGASTYFDVMPAMIGYVLGSKGQTVKMLRQKTGTEIQVTDANPETGMQAITIKGSPDRVQEAYQTIRAMLEKYDPARGKGPPPGLLSGAPPMGPPAMRPPMGPPAYDYAPPHYPPAPGYHAPPDQYGMPPAEEDPYYRGAPPPEYGHPSARDPYGREHASPGRGAVDRYGRPAYPPARDGPPAPEPPARPGAAQGPAIPAGGAPPTAAAAGGANAPQFLVLHPDGTYRPAQIILNVPGKDGQPAAATTAAAAHTAAPATASSTLSQLLAAQPGLSSQAAQLLAAQQLAGLLQQPHSAAAAGQQASAAHAAYQQYAAAAQPAPQQAAYAQPSAYQPAATQQYAQYTQPPAATTYDAAATTAAAGTTAATAQPGLTAQQIAQYYAQYHQLYQQAAAAQPGAAQAAPPSSTA